MSNGYAMSGIQGSMMSPSDYYAMSIRRQGHEASPAPLYSGHRDEARPPSPSVANELPETEDRKAASEGHQGFLALGEFTAPIGVKVIDGLPVPEVFRYDPAFLTQPREIQVYLLREIAAGRLMVRQPSAMTQTSRHSVRLFVGQWEQLKNTISQASPYQDDRRRSLTVNHLLREYIALCQAVLAPHLDLRNVSTAEGLRHAVMRAFEKAAQETLELSEI